MTARTRRFVEHAPALSRRARAIKLADKIANVRDVIEHPPPHWPLARRIEYLDWTEKVVAGCRGTNEALERRYDECWSGEGRHSKRRDDSPARGVGCFRRTMLESRQTMGCGPILLPAFLSKT